MYTVVVVGCGQLGSRYIQGLRKIALPLSIFVVDPSARSLEKARALWNAAQEDTPINEISWFSDISFLPSEIDLAIISTTAKHRCVIVESIARRHLVKYWVLEKVLAQSTQELERMRDSLVSSDASWVNTPRRMMSWHQSLKAELTTSKPLQVSRSGSDWGLACNSIHFIDLIAWWTDETVKSIDVSGLEKNWHRSKRLGFYEIFGSLAVEFSFGSTLLLNASADSIERGIDVLGNQKDWNIDEAKGHAISSRGQKSYGKLELQSEMTECLVTQILTKGTCELPTYIVSMPMHMLLIDQLLYHWNNANNRTDLILPIT